MGEISVCHEVKADINAAPIASVEGRWGFDPNSDEFTQVNTFYHQNKLIQNYHHSLLTYFNTFAHPETNPSENFLTALPGNMYETGAQFYQGAKLKTYALCPEPGNASFSAADFSVCLGYSVFYPKAKVAHDPSVLIHELGHAFSKFNYQCEQLLKQPTSLTAPTLGTTFMMKMEQLMKGSPIFTLTQSSTEMR